ncbi:MAG: U32 family peptidase, partial [Ruminococcus sp.]|nr:U32 family peptidase [Ruminococcus sp.]
LEDFIFSYEAKLQQINSTHTNLPVGAVIYGRLPLMLTRNCPIKNEVGCKNCTMKITDRTGREFPVSCSPNYVEILNSDCLYMYDKLKSFNNVSFGVVILHNENAEQTKAVLSGKKPSADITRGLYYRGI